MHDLRKRLRNWGIWCNHDSALGPATLHCGGLESGYVQECGDVWESAEVRLVPDVADAEKMNNLIRKLERIEQYVLAVEYGGYPVVFRYIRIGDFIMNKIINDAEEKLLKNKCFKTID